MRSLGLSLLRGTLLSLLPILLLCVLSARREQPAEASQRSTPVVRRQHKAVCYPAEASAVRLPIPKVSVLVCGTVQEFDLREYLIGVVGAEMPASFSPEALKAQAVAARTEVYYCARVARPHENAACCTSAACCMAWLSDEALNARWGGEAERWREQVAAAVDATAGEVLLWEGEPIFAAFHAASDGSTENCENVWMQALPYLRAVSSPETAELVPGFSTAVTLDYLTLRDRLQAAAPAAGLEGDPGSWLSGERRSASGRLLSLQVGGVSLSGTAFRFALGLKSAAIRWTLGEREAVFTSTGSGHGVGMSQYGAEVMARNGADYREILCHYYSGADLGTVRLQEGEYIADN